MTLNLVKENSMTGNEAGGVDHMKPAPEVCSQCGRLVEPKFFKGWGYISLKTCKECEAEAEEKQREEKRRLEYESIMGDSNLPKSAMNRTVSFKAGQQLISAGLASAQATHAAYSWDYGATGLYLYGPAGSGKTFLAQCILKQQAWWGRRVLFLEVPALLRELRRGFGLKGKNISKDWVDRAARVRVLALDDLGAEKPTDWSRELILTIFNDRIGARLPTIVTSNHTLAELHDHLGDPKGRIASRIAGCCDPVSVQVQRNGQPVDIRLEMSKARRTGIGTTRNQ
jgi:DNA replication protein DnaC